MSRLRLLLPVAVLAAVLAGCGGGGDEGGRPPSSTAGEGAKVDALVASYDLAANVDQRFIVGLVVGEGKLVSFGPAKFSFAYMGSQEQPVDPPRPGPTVDAMWFPVAGQKVGTPPDRARVVSPSEGTGVYGADNVRFDTPGVWRLTVDVDVEGLGARQATRAFEVLPERQVVVPGEPAPKSENHLPGTGTAPAKAVDSRADSAGAVPDPELHSMTVSAAVASGKPTMVVVSTPVYCQSQFCGPITDSVQKLAQQYGSRMNFVHLEVWRDFEKKEINKSAADWMYRKPGPDANEPWVFVVDAGGTVRHRLDNAMSDAQLEQLVRDELG